MMRQLNFQFPVSKCMEALAVLEPNARLDVLEQGLYVNLDAYRPHEFMEQIKLALGFVNGKAEPTFGSFKKILFTGHRGSGKSTELKRLTRDIKDHYVVVDIDVEQDVGKISVLEPEDLYQLFITSLAEALIRYELPVDVNAFKRITEIWFAHTTLTSETKTRYTTEVGGEVAITASVWLLKVKTFFKSLITAESADMKQVRQVIKNNITSIVTELNVLLTTIRLQMQEKGYQDLVFVVDGTEKIDYKTSKQIFLTDAPILQTIDAHFVFASPVVALYDILRGQEYFSTQILPMMRLTPEAKAAFKQIITQRVNETLFFAPGTLDLLVEYSGGSIRQLIRLCHEAVSLAQCQPVTIEIVEKTVYKEGHFYFDRLSDEHIAILKSGHFVRGDEKTQQMLYNLILMAYNGTTEINPVVKKMIQ
jgi:energy-coupling factor transporter ATP-binding protein EcfA2